VRPIALASPRRQNSRLDSLWVHLLLSIIAGFVIAAITRENTAKFSFWSVAIGGGAAFFLTSSFVGSRLLTPSAVSDPIRGESPGLATSITSSLKSAYAVSSNCLDLWRTPSFAYYLHLDTTTSLVAYSGRFDSPLGRLSADPADQEDFLRYGLNLVRNIANGRAPIEPHRLRLLIYPRWVYHEHEAAIARN
jgi:hypothetical protein